VRYDDERRLGVERKLGDMVRKFSFATLAGVVVAVGGVAGSLILANPAAAISRASAPVNLIGDPGAEHAKPVSSGCKVAVPGWTTAKGSMFTAVAYGASGGFPSAGSPGPANRGKNFFAGGCSGSTNSASQIDSLASYTKLINSGKATFKLSAWLGGYSSQGDYVTLTVTWKSAKGAVLGHKTIGPVTPAQRKDVTGMLLRSATGKVPAAARKADITLRMVREDGEYDDGYADNLSLTIAG
jgi:hypothetical protein